MPPTASLHERVLDQLRAIYGDQRDDWIQTYALEELLYQSTRPAPKRAPDPEVPMVLIEVRNSSGVVGRCDAKCYAATEPDCDCCCGGVNHAKGLEQALANMPAIVADQIPHAWMNAHAADLPPGTYAVAQLPLWLNVAGAEAVARIAQELHRRADIPPAPATPEPPETPGIE